jgi:pyroglutamyl-peptidase
MKVLLTGFGPFKDFDTNPSGEVVRAFDMEGVVFRKEILDVNKEAILGRYPVLLDEFQPEVIINVGLNAASGTLNLETFALNSLKDDQAAFSTLEGPWGYRTSLDTQALADRLCDAGIPAVRSDHAGNYYCNFIYYLSLEWGFRNGGQALFLHMPFTTHLAAKAAKEKKRAFPSLPLATVHDGLRLILEACRPKGI